MEEEKREKHKERHKRTQARSHKGGGRGALFIHSIFGRDTFLS
jgi:hypothetical protein